MCWIIKKQSPFFYSSRQESSSARDEPSCSPVERTKSQYKKMERRIISLKTLTVCYCKVDNECVFRAVGT